MKTFIFIILFTFILNGDESFLDTYTGLIWQSNYKESVTWNEAKSYCENLSLDHEEWRLPKTSELLSLIDYSLFDPATIVDDCPSEWFWGSEFSGDHSAAWIIWFYDGFVEYTEKQNLYFVRCVR